MSDLNNNSNNGKEKDTVPTETLDLEISSKSKKNEEEEKEKEDSACVILKETTHGMTIAYVKTGKDGTTFTSSYCALSNKIEQLLKLQTPSLINEYREIASFMSRRTKGTNYIKNCMGMFKSDEFENVKKNKNSIMRRYTTEKGWFCTTVNLLLASDHNILATQEYSLYVRQLKSLLGFKKEHRHKGIVYRGANMTPIELLTYRFKKIFYIPSFVSTSTVLGKAFTKYNTTIEIDLSEFSDYSGLIVYPDESQYDESECLISCYNIYEYLGYDLEKSILKLKVKNYYKYNDEKTNSIKFNEGSKDLVEAINIEKVPVEYFVKTHTRERLLTYMNNYEDKPQMFDTKFDLKKK